MMDIWWIGPSVTLVAGLIFGVAAHLSPKGDWEFIKGGPAYFMGALGFSVAFSQALPKREYNFGQIVCNPLPCHVVGNGFENHAPEHSIGETVFDWITSALVDIPAEAVGVAVGIGLGIALFGRRRPETP